MGGRGGTDASGAGGRGGAGGSAGSGGTGGSGATSGTGGTNGQAGRGGAGGSGGGQGGATACGQATCVDCCTSMTPGGPAAYYTKMYECACSEPCYSQACKASCDSGAAPPTACIACVRANAGASQFCISDVAACAADASCKAYSACLFGSCP
jgi:hypothetical protein